MITSSAFSGKHYAVYGLARSGLATAEALIASGATVTAWDSNEEARANPPAGVAVENLDTADLSQFDSLVVTPGLPLNTHPIAARAREAGLEIIGDIELFARARHELAPHKVIGITGTNGKSTTTALVYHLLTTAGVPSAMGGNIGLPILAQDPLPDGGVYVLELSSYQLDLTQSLDCDVAVLLNITPDHLDRYDNFEAYAQSKARLIDMQSDEHVAIFGFADDAVMQISGAVAQRRQVEIPGVGLMARNVFIFSDQVPPEQSEWPALQGPHNAENAAAAIAATSALYIGEGKLPEALVNAIAEAPRTFPGLPHRMEKVREKDGVAFVNDSKATNPTAAAPALASFPAIRWIVGGQAKTDSLEECEALFGNVRSAYAIGESAELFEKLLSPHMPVKNCGKLDDALREAAADAEAGDTVLLSPACASFDQYRDFEHRGDTFRELVGAL